MDRKNNFDLLRLFAASQVVWFHAINNLELRDPLPAVSSALHLFPGVPIFFVISGYLISMSYERSRSLGEYALNRFLRIYPALVVCFACTLVMLTAAGVWHRIDVSPAKLLQWVAMQLTIGQFYSPHVVNQAYGVGHTNGSLWTITVELQFYIAIPMIYLALRRLGLAAGNALIVLLLLASYAFSRLWAPSSETLQTLTLVGCLQWIYMFLGGVLLQRNREKLAPWIDGKGLYWLAAYVLAASVGVQMGASLGLRVNILLYVLIACTVVSLAHTGRELSERLLRRNDLSYGVYIYHMVVVNALYETWYRGDAQLLSVVFLLTFAAAAASWRFVERPALALKRRSLRPVEPQAESAAGARRRVT